MKDAPRRKRRKQIAKPPPRLTVEVFCQDPLVAKNPKLGLVSVRLDGERCLDRGPMSARVEVVDYDADTNETHEPVGVRPDGTGFTLAGSGDDVRSNYFFHQVNVWAIVNRTLALLEEPGLLGRPVSWASGRGRLTVMPHAGRGENAYYDREAGALRLLYFGDPPNRTFACLSHDIVTHELGHAVLDGLKPGYDAVSSPDTAGFHEFFGDALALTSSLTFRNALAEAVGKTQPELSAEFLACIGEEFGMGSSRGDHAWVRRFTERWTLDELIENDNLDEYAYSQVLSGLYFELLGELYKRKLAEKKQRDQRDDGGVAVGALVNAAKQAARTMLCAVDYCPPVDVSLLQYARAVLRADQVAFPRDDGVRAMLASMFIDRGIGKTPADLEAPRPCLRNRDLYPYDVDALASTSEAAYRFLDENRDELGIPRSANFAVVRRYRTRKQTASGYFPPREVVLEFAWAHDVAVDGDPRYGTLAGKRFPLQCGGTLVFDENGNVLHYVIQAPTDERRARLLAYLASLVERGRIEMPDGPPAPLVAFCRGDHVELRRTPALRHHGMTPTPTPPAPSRPKRRRNT